MTTAPEQFSHFAGRPVRDKPPPVHHQNTVRERERFLQPVFREKDRGTKLSVHLADGGQEIRGGNGVKLAGGLVQNEDGGLHGHDAGQVQQLLLAPGEFRHVLIKPGLDAEEGGHLRHPAADGGGIIPQALQPEGQLVPHLVRDNLILRGLLHKSDPGALGPLVYLVQGCSFKENASSPVSGRGQHRFELPEKGGFAAAAGSAESDELPLGDGEGKMRQGVVPLLRIGEAQVPDLKRFHFTSSLLFRISGVKHRAR